MAYTGTHEKLFTPPVKIDSLFEKEASISKMPDDEKKWPAHILSELHKSLPFLSEYDVDLSLDRQDPESGYALGYAMIRNKSVRNRPQDEVGQSKNRMRIPLIVEDRELQPFHTFELGGSVYPLTPERVEAAMVNPVIFDGPVSRVPRAPSLVDNLYPPYQQRQGFGRTAEPDTAGIVGFGKSASAPEDEFLDGLSKAGRFRLVREGGILKAASATDAPNYRAAAGETSCGTCKFFTPSDSGGQGQCSKFDFTALASHACDAWVTRDATKEASSPMTKEARLIGRPMAYSEYGDHWLKKFEGTPFLNEAYSLKEAEAIGEATRAQRRAARAQARADDAQFDIKIASLEGDFAKWRMKQIGMPMSDTLSKLASCRHDNDRVWSDEFAGTPFHKQAMVLAVEDAHREVRRAGRDSEEEREYREDEGRRENAAVLELKLAEWRLDSTYGTKIASAVLRFQEGVGLPGSMVFAAMKDKPNFRMAVPPSDFWFYPLPGTNFLMGVHKSYQQQLKGVNDQQQLKGILAVPMREEMMAARAGQPSPGKFLLVVKHGQVYQYVKPEFTAALAGAGGPGNAGAMGVDQTLGKSAEAPNHPGKSHDEAHPGESHARRGARRGAMVGGALGAGVTGLSALGLRRQGHSARTIGGMALKEGLPLAVAPGAAAGALVGGLRGKLKDRRERKASEKKASLTDFIEKEAKVFGAERPDVDYLGGTAPHKQKHKDYTRYFKQKAGEGETGVGKATGVGAGIGGALGGIAGGLAGGLGRQGSLGGAALGAGIGGLGGAVTGGLTGFAAGSKDRAKVRQAEQMVGDKGRRKAYVNKQISKAPGRIRQNREAHEESQRMRTDMGHERRHREHMNRLDKRAEAPTLTARLKEMN